MKIKKYFLLNNFLRILLVSPHDRENFINFIKNPYSDSEKKFGVIFIHIPKAAGKTISYSLLEASNGTGHNKMVVYERNKSLFDKSYKFTFVRNPWDRLVSAFFYMKSFHPKSNDRKFFDKYVGQTTSFESFVYKLRDPKFRKLCLKWEHFTPQVDFLRNSKGQIVLDYIGRVENIDEDFEFLKGKINPRAKIKSRNIGDRRQYSTYYNNETEKIVQEIYSEDINEFGYKFNE